jgi:AhpD family alkylhydroperoxidase
MSNPFSLHTSESAPETVRGAMKAVQKRTEFIPTTLAKFAEAPALLMAYQTAAPFFEKTSLTPAERTVVLMAASHRHDCDFCMSAHSWGAHRQGIGDAIWQRQS